MTKMNRKNIHSLLLFALLLLPFTAGAQNDTSAPEAASVEVKALFKYPVAPDSLAGFTEMSDWLVTNFWNDFKPTNATVSQIALTHAFNAWSAPLRFAHRDVAVKAVDALIKKVEKYPTLLYQLTKAADDVLYSDRAEVWIDEPVLQFANALVKNKKLDATRKARYNLIARQLGNSTVGRKFPQLQLVNAEGKKYKLTPLKTGMTVVMLGEPDCSDCRMAKVKFDMSQEFADAISSGRVAFNFVIPDAEDAEGWETMVATYPSSWIVGAASGAEEIVDLRYRPAIYVINSSGEILLKTKDAEQTIDFITSTL